MADGQGNGHGSVALEEQYLALLLRASEVLAQSLDYRETLQNACNAAVSTVADIAIVDLGELGDTTLVAAAHCEPARTPEVRGAGVHLDSAPDRPQHPVCQVLKTGHTFYAPQIDDKWIEQNASRPEHAEYLRRMQYTSMIVVPLRSQVFGIAGALTLATVAGHRSPFSPDNVRFAEGLGRLFSTAIGKARLYDVAHATATTLQRSILPRILPHPPGIEFFARYEPASETLLVGGDWYDVFPLPDGRIGVCVGDVSGHGLSASILMASIRTALRSTLTMEPDIVRALDVADYLIHLEDQNQFCTAILGIIDIEAMTLRLASAGHPGPKIWDPNAKVVLDPFTDRDPPLGLRELAKSRTKPKTVRVERGALVVFYSDGLVEWNRDGVSGEQQLEKAIRQRVVRDARDPALAVRAAVIGTAKAHDDTAILVARFA